MPPSPREVAAAATGRSFAPLASLPEGGGRLSDRKEFRPLPASLPEGGGRRSDRKEFPQAATPSPAIPRIRNIVNVLAMRHTAHALRPQPLHAPEEAVQIELRLSLLNRISVG